jgi:hypothetical protein
MQAVPKKYISISIKPIWRAEVLVIVMVISREKKTDFDINYLSL